MVGSPTLHIFGVFGCKCYILKKGTRLDKFKKKNMMKDSYLVTPLQENIMKDSYLVTPLQAKHIEFEI
jgi:hypothetical protein